MHTEAIHPGDRPRAIPDERRGGATGTRTPIPAVQEQCSAFEPSPQGGPLLPRAARVNPARREGIEPSRREFWRLPGLPWPTSYVASPEASLTLCISSMLQSSILFIFDFLVAAGGIRTRDLLVPLTVSSRPGTGKGWWRWYTRRSDRAELRGEEGAF